MYVQKGLGDLIDRPVFFAQTGIGARNSGEVLRLKDGGAAAQNSKASHQHG